MWLFDSVRFSVSRGAAVGNREERTMNAEGLGRPLTLNLTAWIGELCGFRATNYDNILPLCIWH